MVIPVVNKEECISCGNCVDLCPEVFNWDEDGKAEVIDPGGCGGKCPSCEEAAESCPTNAITIEESSSSGSAAAEAQD
jgi:ferredoxin